MSTLTLTARSTPLPDAWVERIFARMFGLYGSLWLDRWRTEGGEAVGVAMAKSTWAAELGTFADQPAAIARALEACADLQFPPTLPEFRALCRQHYQRPPEPAYEKRGPLALSGPHAEKVREQFGRLSLTPEGAHDYLRWARRCEKRAQMRMLCDAIREGREVSRLVPLLQGHVQTGASTVNETARRIAQAAS